MQLHQAQHLSTMIDVRQSRVKSIAFRKEILEKQKTRNYQSEYDKIRSHLEGSANPYKSREGLKSRASHLKSLGARALDNIV